MAESTEEALLVINVEEKMKEAGRKRDEKLFGKQVCTGLQRPI